MINEVRKRHGVLKDVLRRIERDLEKLPSGSVRASAHGNGYQYYIRSSISKINGDYVKKKDIKNAARIVRHEYLLKCRNSIIREIGVIDNYFEANDFVKFEDVYSHMPLGKQLLITPIIESEEEFLNRYMSLQYEQPPFNPDDPEYYSDKNERMRSKSEMLIANKLIKAGIPYRYEMPLELDITNTWGEKVTVHPDFTVIDYKNRKLIYWEHLGMLGDESYVNNSIRKIRGYEKSGIHLGESLIITCESLQTPLDIKLINQKIKNLAEWIRCNP